MLHDIYGSMLLFPFISNFFQSTCMYGWVYIAYITPVGNIDVAVSCGIYFLLSFVNIFIHKLQYSGHLWNLHTLKMSCYMVVYNNKCCCFFTLTRHIWPCCFSLYALWKYIIHVNVYINTNFWLLYTWN